MHHSPKFSPLVSKSCPVVHVNGLILSLCSDAFDSAEVELHHHENTLRDEKVAKVAQMAGAAR